MINPIGKNIPSSLKRAFISSAKVKSGHPDNFRYSWREDSGHSSPWETWKAGLIMQGQLPNSANSYEMKAVLIKILYKYKKFLEIPFFFLQNKWSHHGMVGWKSLTHFLWDMQLSLADAHGSSRQSSFLNLIVAVGRQSIWVVAVFRLTKDRLLKDFFFPLQLDCWHWSWK